MTIKQIEKEILTRYKKGKYSPTGSDGGCLKYMILYIDDKKIHASITEDFEIKKIIPIIELSFDDVEIYNHKEEYYNARI